MLRHSQEINSIEPATTHNESQKQSGRLLPDRQELFYKSRGNWRATGHPKI